MPNLSTGEYKQRAWSERDEIAFMNRLLGHVHPQAKYMHQVELMRRYIAGLMRRTEWDGIDRLAVLHAANARLRTMTARRAA